MSKKGETESLLGANRNASLVDVCDASIRHALFQVVDDVGIVRSTATHVYLLNAVFGTPAFVSVGEGLSSDASDRRNAVFGVAPSNLA
jgi:hypothetical protein